MSIRLLLENQVKDLERINNKMESIINHRCRYLLDVLIIDYIISQRNKIELALQVSTFSLNNTEDSLLKSIYDANTGLRLDILEDQLDYYLKLIDVN